MATNEAQGPIPFKSYQFRSCLEIYTGGYEYPKKYENIYEEILRW